MNPIAEEIARYLTPSEQSDDDGYLAHYGVGALDGAPGRGSGRYPLGSGENPNQHGGDLISRVTALRRDGVSDTDIAKMMGMSTTKFRAELGNARKAVRAEKVAMAQQLASEGLGPTEISRRMGLSGESAARALLSEGAAERMTRPRATADILKKVVDKKGMVDVGTGVELELGISREMLKQSLDILEKEGYVVHGGRVPQVTNPGKQTTLKILCTPGTEHKQIYEYDKIGTVSDYISTDGGATYRKAFEYPSSLDSKRVKIRYAEDGGLERDGLVELRRGVDDISLGKSNYAQVRIMVDGTHYIKGMAVYGDESKMPDGVDVIFNTNKKRGTPLHDVLKPIKDDPDNPFGSLIKEHGGQSYYDDPNGKFIDKLTGKRQSLSKINKRAEEGDWDEWADRLPSQFLSKQNEVLIKRQLGLASADKYEEFDDICSLTNPTLKKHLLETFANDCDSAAVHLYAAALPRQRYQVILPVPSLKETEVYAPNFHDGEKVALIRYPHAGTFEIPILTVNNKHKDSKAMIGGSPLDAVGINSKVAERLSGADFDGDTVMVIPTGGKVNITSTRPLEGLVGFDPKARYPKIPGMKFMKDPKTGVDNTQTEMGKISNLITDMSLHGAPASEMERAVRHSMVVIDAAKHELDYKQSEKDNGIAQLKRKYQGHINEKGNYSEGAATLISRASGEKTVDKRQGQPRINTPGKPWYDPDKPEGSLIYKTVDELYYTDKKTGKRVRRTQKSDQMSETDDAYTLSSGTVQESLYADYANSMKALANTARKEMVSTPRIKISPSAKKTYAAEVSSLKAKLNTAKMNAPRERAAQLLANSEVKAKIQDNPDMSKKEKKKASQLALTKARQAVGAKRTPIELTEREKEAIQAGAISENVLMDILKNTDLDELREWATPRNKSQLRPAQISLIQSMRNSGYSNDDIAKRLGVSVSTVIKYIKE